MDERTQRGDVELDDVDENAPTTSFDEYLSGLPGPTEREQARIAAAQVRNRARDPRPEIKLNAEIGPDQYAAVAPSHSDMQGTIAHLMDAFGTSSFEFVAHSLQQLAAIAKNEDQAVNAMLAVVDGIRPENEAETMLAVQMAGTHALAMKMLERAGRDNLDVRWHQEYGNLAVKLLRTSTAQAEALAKLRRKGEQRVVVEHVHVHAGGQAVVGHVEVSGAGGRGPAKIEDQSHALVDARCPEVRGQDARRESVPITFATQARRRSKRSTSSTCARRPPCAI